MHSWISCWHIGLIVGAESLESLYMPQNDSVKAYQEYYDLDWVPLATSTVRVIFERHKNCSLRPEFDDFIIAVKSSPFVELAHATGLSFVAKRQQSANFVYPILIIDQGTLASAKRPGLIGAAVYQL